MGDVTKKKPREAGNGPSIADVAREAGVATSTVSRALTMPGRIAEPTRLKVVEAARKLGYTANQTARNLRVGHTRTIMIVLPETLYVGASQVVIEVLRDVAQTLTERGFTLLIANVSREATTDEHILELAFGGTISGVLLMASPVPSFAGRSLLEAGLPVVSLHFDMSDQGIQSVISDDRAAIERAVDALIGMGHRSFLYVQGRAGNYHELERNHGIRSALARAGLPAGALRTFPGDFNFSGGVAAGKYFLGLEDRPTALVCANDDTAIGFIKTVVDSGLNVPADVSVIGFDGAAVGAFTLPSLSTVRQETSELGRRAANLIVDKVVGNADPATPVVVPCALLLRQSVRRIGPGAGRGPQGLNQNTSTGGTPA